MWHYNYGPSLMHYASKYYDPVKAHEYYEKHKKLKGERPKVTLNEEGRAVAETVKEKINEERDQNLSKEDEKYKQEQRLRADAKSRTMEQHREIMNQRISSLQNYIKRIPKDRVRDEAPKIRAIIEKLREDNNTKRQSIEERYKSESAKASEQNTQSKKNIRDTAKSTYESEYNKILSESKYQKTSGKKSGGVAKKKFD